MADSPCERTLTEQLELLNRGEISSEDLTRATLDRVQKSDAAIRSYLRVSEATALLAAREADARRARGEKAALLGVPVAVKDIFLTQGVETTCSSRILEGYVPPYDAHAVSRLKAAGAVILGKLNMDEFAMGSSTETSAFQLTRNPWNLDYIPGGSSGGSASAVAARQCAASLGTDTGGSIRQPAALCGVVGMKPTYGRVSRYGVMAFASSLDQVGPLTRTVEDCARVLGVIAGRDPRDSTSSERAVPDYLASIGKRVKGFKLGVPKEYFIPGMDREVKAAVEAVVSVYERMGVSCNPVSLPHTEYAVATYYIIAPAEASSNLARYDGVRYGKRAQDAKTLHEVYEKSRSQGFGREVTRRMMLGTYVLSAGYYDAYYRKAQKVRTLILRDFEAAFEKVDAILTPVSPTPAFKIGEKTDDPLAMYLSDIFTIPTNLAGLPGISVPCGFSSGGLPIGFQLIGKAFDEATLLQLGHAYQGETDWHCRAPNG